MNEPVAFLCAHGWHRACRHCARIAAELDAQFQRDVFFGVYNARGYTPTEWANRKRSDKVGHTWAPIARSRVVT